MRVLIINTSQRTGGAAVAANRLNVALNNHGIQSSMLVRDSLPTPEPNVVTLPHARFAKRHFLWERFVIWVANRFSRQNLFAVDIANAGNDITALPEFRNADVIHLHWVNQGMLSIDNIRKIIASGKPVVWTMHDMWPATAICHYARECAKYKTSCSHCHMLQGNDPLNLSHHIFKRKLKLYSNAHIHFVTCSRWLKNCVVQSALFTGQTVTSIPNPIDTDTFKPIPKAEARQRFALPADKKLILFGALKVTDKRKGFDYLVDACNILADRFPHLRDEIGIVAFGTKADEVASMLPFRVYPLGYFTNENDIANIYNAVDIFVTPSLEDNLPNTIMESLACATPCVGFNVGGIPEMIDHRSNGYVAQYRSADDLARGIYWTLYNAPYDDLATAARNKVMSEYSQAHIASLYTSLYQSLC